MEKLDIPKKTGGGNMSAMSRFKAMDKKGESENATATKMETLHQNSIR